MRTVFLSLVATLVGGTAMRRVLTFIVTLPMLGLFALPHLAHGQEHFVGEIKLVGFNFCPRGFAAADGQLLQISANAALFSLFGITYGGDGQTTFALPDLRGRVPIHVGQGPGLGNRVLGEEDGEEAHILTVDETPAHTHPLNATNKSATEFTPEGNLIAAERNYVGTGIGSEVPMDSSSIGSIGNGQPHNNMQPFLTLRFCVALVGVFPSRN